MADKIDDLIKEMAEFKGMTVTALTGINDSLKQTEENRQRNSDRLWEHIEEIKKGTQDEKTDRFKAVGDEKDERVKGDNKLCGELKIIKERQRQVNKKAAGVGGAGGGIGAGIVIAIKLFWDHLTKGGSQ